jgi:hypothetical protein
MITSQQGAFEEKSHCKKQIGISTDTPTNAADLAQIKRHLFKPKR